MVFSSSVFLFFFLPAVFLLTRVCKRREVQNLILALASILFYAFGQITYVPLFLISICINYASAALIQKLERYRKPVLIVSVIMNLGILCAYKYLDFIVANLNSLLALSIPAPGIILPIGISFFTFQGMSYVIDVYRRPDAGSGSFLKVLLYVSFFPQLIAGPIIKYHDIADQIDHRSLSPEKTDAGVCRFIIGLSKKVLLADSAGYIANTVFSLESYGSADFRLLWLGALCYMLQIYYDFSGYSDMAIGLGKMFGFEICENFLHPYGSGSIKEFWRRWHISLSSWFREYLYIPLGGNRKGKYRTAVNKLIVFLATGIWHGANWTFVLWGLGHGLLLSLEDWGILPVSRLKETRAGRFVSRIYVLLSVMLLFVLFRADSLGSAGSYLAAMFSGTVTADGAFMLSRLLQPATVLLLLFGILGSGNLPRKLSGRLESAPFYPTVKHILCILALLLSIFSLAKGGFHPFIYFQF